MISDAARAAAVELFSPPFRSVFIKTLGLTLLALLALWAGLTSLLEWTALPWLHGLLPGLPSWAGVLGVVIGAIALAFAMALSLGDLGAVALFGSDNLMTLPWLVYSRMGNYRTADADGLALLLGLICLALTVAGTLPRAETPEEDRNR